MGEYEIKTPANRQDFGKYLMSIKAQLLSLTHKSSGRSVRKEIPSYRTVSYRHDLIHVPALTSNTCPSSGFVAGTRFWSSISSWLAMETSLLRGLRAFQSYESQLKTSVPPIPLLLLICLLQLVLSPVPKPKAILDPQLSSMAHITTTATCVSSRTAPGPSLCSEPSARPPGSSHPCHHSHSLTLLKYILLHCA